MRERDRHSGFEVLRRASPAGRRAGRRTATYEFEDVHYGAAVNPLSYLSCKTVVKQSTIHGRGLFARALIAAGETVAIKGGHIVSGEVLKKFQPLIGPAEIQIGADLFICPVTKQEREGSMIFSNHSCNPNIGLRGEITFVTMRDVAAGEELTHDWAMTDDDDDSSTECRCGAPDCRVLITGKDWQRPDLQERYGQFFSSYLLAKIERIRHRR